MLAKGESASWIERGKSPKSAMSRRRPGRPANVTVGGGYSSGGGSESEPNSPTGFTRNGARAALSPELQPNQKIRKQVKNYVQEMRKLSDKRRRSSGEENHAAPYADAEGGGPSFRLILMVLLAAVWLFVLLAAALRRKQLAPADGAGPT